MTVNISGDTGISQVQSGAIEATDIPNNTITGDKIVNDAITVNKLHTQIQGALGTRNLIINGDMNIAQRGTSATGITSNGYYTVDRIQFFEATDGTYSMSQDTDVPTGQGFVNSVKFNTTTTTTVTGIQSLRFRQIIEGQHLQHLKFGTSDAETITLSFWIKSNLTGNFVARIAQYRSGGTDQIGSLVTINSADTWEKKTVTFIGNTEDAITNANTAGFNVEIYLAAGPDITSGTLPSTWTAYNEPDVAVGQTIDLASSTSNYVNITGVQLELGDTATPFEHRPYDMELQRCYRYYWKGDGTYYATRYSNGAFETIDLPTHMRVRPTISYSSTNAAGSFTDYSRTTRIQLYDSTDATYNVNTPVADAEL